MPLPTTAINTASSFMLSTLRKIIISGRESAMTDIMKARTVPGRPFSEQCLYDRDNSGSIGVHWNA